MSDRLSKTLADARQAARFLRTSTAQQRSDVVAAIAAAIERNQDEVLRANQADMEQATGLTQALQDRLLLTKDRLRSLAASLREVAELPDPLGAPRDLAPGPSGIQVQRMRIPLGVVAIVYEARPNVTAECAALCIKSGNAAVLRGGKEAERSNELLAQCVNEALSACGFPSGSAQVLTRSNRQEVQDLLRAVGKVDLVIPRGGEGLMTMVDEVARVPVIRHGQGICHVYVAAEADVSKAVSIAYDAKVDRPGVCNAMETLLVHQQQSSKLLAQLGPALQQAGVALKADERALAALKQNNVDATPATPEDWSTEFLGPTLAIRVVDSLQEALDHIDSYGSHHSASIVSTSEEEAQVFLRAVDASCVLWNASTRFNDGGQLGLGAEMGISTSKMHAYGPMGLVELTAEKFVVRGEGQTRGPPLSGR